MQHNQRSTARDGFKNQVETYLLTNFEGAWNAIQRVTPAHRLINRTLINNVIYKIPTRPYPLSTLATYTSWDSLNDRSFSGRHLPPGNLRHESLPPIEEVVKLFARKPGQTIPSGKSTLLFCHFAQWFTDGFLRTDRTNYLKNTSNHEIDLCPLYGLNSHDTNLIRSHERGKLKSQWINGEEYPPYLCEPDGAVHAEFADLPQVLPEELAPERRSSLFAMGGDRANVQVGYVMFNTLFLREHNRLCDQLAHEHPTWNDERLFQTARNIVIALVIRIVIEEYINHITPYRFKFLLDPKQFAGERWYRQNWMCAEFTLVYRWHGLVTDHYCINGRAIPALDALWNNGLLIERGLGGMFEDATLQPAGEVCLGNTPSFLLNVERASLHLGRASQLASYNDYRELCGFPRATAFDQITGNVAVQRELQRLYGHVDNIEFYVGLFAEDVRKNAAVGPLIGRFVGIDAFSQALTNPLLAEHVFNATTFSRTGMQTLAQTKTLADILHRNIPRRGQRYRVSLTQLKQAN